MKNKIILMLGCILCLFVLGGCSSDEDVSSMTAYTSVYPVEYILDNLYGDKIAIYSIYPDGINYKNYNLTEKEQILKGIDYINDYGFNINRNIKNDAIINK